MFTGWTNQMTSWIGAKKTQSPSEPGSGSPSNAEGQQPESTTPTSNEGEAASVVADAEQQNKGIELFNSMKSQMTNWSFGFGPLSKGKESKEKEEEPAAADQTEEPTESATAETAKSVEEGAEGEEDKDKETFGSGLEEVSTKALQGAKTFGNFFVSAVSKAGKTVTEAGAKIKKTVEETSLLTEFNKEQEAFIKSKNKTGEALPPWVGYPDEDALKEEILSLSTDRRNFVRSPPSGVQFQFDYETTYPIALAILAEDPNLQQMRFELVPKIIKEELFWRNYFYRVSLIKQSTELSSLAQEGGNRDSPQSHDSSFDDDDKTDDADLAGDSPQHEFVSDAYQNPTLSKDLKEVQEGIKRLGGSHKKQNEEEWEKELQAELQDYELGSEGSGQTGGPDADDIEEMLDAEESHGTDLK